MHPPLKSLIILATVGLPGVAMAAPNGDFTDVNPLNEDTNFAAVDIGGDTGIGYLPSWTFLRDLTIATRDSSATVSVAGSAITDAPDPVSGTGVFSFEEITDDYNANRLEQCVAIDENLDIKFSYQVFTNRGSVNNSLRLQLNTNFYSDLETCNRDMQANSTANRLTDAEFDVNRRFHFGDGGVLQNEWALVEEANRETTGPMVHPAEQISDGAKAVRLSLRPFSFNADSDPDDVRIWLDDIRVEQDGRNLLVNHDFSDPDLMDGEFVTADASGWQLALAPRNGVVPLASAGDLPFALSGENGVYFKRLTGEYDDTSLVQCISRADIPSGVLQPSANVTSDEPAAGLTAAIRAEFFTDGACTNADTLEDLAGELEITGDARQWQFLGTTGDIAADSIAGSGSMRLTLSVRDRTGGSDGPDAALARTVFMDDVQLSALTLARPTFSPSGDQSFLETLTVTVDGRPGTTLYITTDGSDPDTSSMAYQPGETIVLTETTELRAIASDGQATSEVQSALYTRLNRSDLGSESSGSSFGCSLGGAKDPVLPLLVLLALVGLARSKWRANA
ncbi:FN3 associated domain-containing protein [Marinobacter confluentis]|uniref:Uncharacterized protein n=1 Tax=Marinobacter confluentis TaxID=1697557 RepID=A0A4Z1C9A5_9GAMM|nr:FN3 associated domain-containing protein [Marinobacter confluentis]TGN40203.1 hypothetical protein E5Q11_07915 [Marinobacter confluentis]